MNGVIRKERKTVGWESARKLQVTKLIFTRLESKLIIFPKTATATTIFSQNQLKVAVKCWQKIISAKIRTSLCTEKFIPTIFGNSLLPQMLAREREKKIKVFSYF